MNEKRPATPMEVKRKVLVEAGHRCAIPTCRSLDVDIHHIIPWNESKSHEYNNLIALCPNCHRRSDRGIIDKKSLYMYKGNLRLLYDRFSIFEIDLLFDLNKMEDGEIIELPSYFLFLMKRIIEIGYVLAVERPDKKQRVGEINGIRAIGIDYMPYDVSVTSKGREFIDEIRTKDIGY